MDILNSPLVKKYFGQQPGEIIECDDSQLKHIAWLPYEWYMAYKVLRAMQEPIRNGERYLHLSSDGEVHERINEYDDVPVIHVSSLRLPDQFQKPIIHTAKCEGCGEPVSHPPVPKRECPLIKHEHCDVHGYCHDCQPQRDEVENKCRYSPPFINDHSQCGKECVETKLQEIKRRWHGSRTLEEELRELVRLVMETRKRENL